MMITKRFNNLLLGNHISIDNREPYESYKKMIPDEYSACKLLMKLRFGENLNCYKCSGGPLKSSSECRLWKCDNCNYSTYPTEKTYFDRIDIPALTLMEILREFSMNPDIDSDRISSGFKIPKEVSENLLTVLNRIAFRTPDREQTRYEIVAGPPYTNIHESTGEDPWSAFSYWFDKGYATGLPNPNAMTLATTDVEGRPSARIVLLKDWSEESGFIFFTNYGGKKSQDISANNNVALLFFWDILELQIRIEGKAHKVSQEKSKAYFDTRPRMSRIGAWSSSQSSYLANREEFADKIRENDKKFPGEDIPLPDFWGGWAVIPDKFEFWKGHANRLHERLVFEMEHPKVKKSYMLYP